MIPLKSLLLKHTNKTTMNTQQTSTSNPFTHEGATYEDAPTEAKPYRGSSVENSTIYCRNITLSDILDMLAEKTGRDNLNVLLSDQQKEAIINNLETEIEDSINQAIYDALEDDLEVKVFDSFTSDDCEPTQDYAFTPV